MLTTMINISSEREYGCKFQGVFQEELTTIIDAFMHLLQKASPSDKCPHPP